MPPLQEVCKQVSIMGDGKLWTKIINMATKTTSSAEHGIQTAIWTISIYKSNVVIRLSITWILYCFITILLNISGPYTRVKMTPCRHSVELHAVKLVH